MKKIHLIAIGGAIMHQLAIALKLKGYSVSGSDDAIYDPARSNLQAQDLLPTTGWSQEVITDDLDQIIVGMHARADNPELLKAQSLGLPIASFPEFVAKECQDKTRLVVAGSHGKTTTTSMIMHVLKKAGIDFDYLVGSSIDGFDYSVRLSDAPLIVIEGDEYLSSPLDRRSKFLWYAPDVSIITGIAYDHINVFPSFDAYLDTFKAYIALHEESTLVWYQGDQHLQALMAASHAESIPYNTPQYTIDHGHYTLLSDGRDFPLNVIGEHNLQNIIAAALACEKIGIPRTQFFELIADFSGAGKRMEKIYETEEQVVFRDFAHSPSKLEATTNAVKQTYGTTPLTAAFELHTFSSLNRSFLSYYKNCMQSADEAMVYIDPHVFEHRNMEILSKAEIKEAFGNVQVLDDPMQLKLRIQAAFDAGNNILLMSSGTFSGTEFLKQA